MSMETLTRAWEVLQDAYQAQMEGDYDRAVELYQSSLELHPTAEAHTFLGWTYHFQGRVEEAIAECKRAIELDPEFGNPYNDIGAYLIELGRFDEAIPWLERSEEHTSELQSRLHLVCRLLLEKKHRPRERRASRSGPPSGSSCAAIR